MQATEKVMKQLGNTVGCSPPVVITTRSHSLLGQAVCAAEVFAPNFIPVKNLEVLMINTAGGMLTIFKNICSLEVFVTPESASQALGRSCVQGKLGAF